MSVDANDRPTAFEPRHHRYAVRKRFPNLVRGFSSSDRNVHTGNIVSDPRSRTPSPDPFKLVVYSHDSPRLKEMHSPTPKRSVTRVFKDALERVISLTRKRQRTGDEFDNSCQHGSPEKSATPQRPQKTPRRGTFLPSSPLFAPPGLERCGVERPAVSLNPNIPPFSSPLIQPSIINHGLHTAIPRPEPLHPNTSCHEERKMRLRLPIGRLVMANPSRPVRHHLSSLKDFKLPRPFDAQPDVASQLQLDQTMGDDTAPVLPAKPGNVRAKRMPMPVCSNPKSFYYDGEEPKTGRCESPEQIPQYYDRPLPGAGIYSTGGNGYTPLWTPKQGAAIYADYYAMGE